MHIVDEWTEGLPSVEDSQVVSYSEKTRVYANDKTTLLAEFYLQDQEPVTIDQVNEYVLEGTVATEDERFYEHEGVDLMGIARALVNNLLGGDLEGASTITPVSYTHLGTDRPGCGEGRKASAGRPPRRSRTMRADRGGRVRPGCRRARLRRAGRIGGSPPSRCV